jgi:TrpR family trp operon transcriptional repressor
MNKSEIMEILAELTDPKEVEQFCSEILTPKEQADLALRWQLMKELHQGETQRAIAKRHGMSLCKITRGSKILQGKESIIRKILNRSSNTRERS